MVKTFRTISWRETLVSAVIAATLVTPVAAQSKESAAAFMKSYTDTWNQHDTEALATEYWDTKPTVEEEKSQLDAMFDRLVSQGYDKSTIHEIQTCMTDDTTAWAGMKFTRNTTDGGVIGDDPQASHYVLGWTDEKGWRVKSVKGADAADELTCPE